LQDALTEREKKKKQLHKVFKDSFDAKVIFSEKFLVKKPAWSADRLNYIHHNPVSGKWNPAADFVSYEHSSASFYEDGVIKHFEPKHYKSLQVEFIIIQSLLYIGVSRNQFYMDNKFGENPDVTKTSIQ
jgi:hypothetical protein